MACLEGHIDAGLLRFYRKGHSHLPGHPELGFTPGIKFSSGRLGHMWAAVNGVAMANPGKQLFCLGSDGSQMEGNDAEAARLAVAQGLNVNLVLDDNDVTITGHPSQYLKGCVLEKTLAGHGLAVQVADGEDIDAMYAAMRAMLLAEGPTAVVAKRKMCPGIQGVEGTSHGHDALAVPSAIAYMEARGTPAHKAAIEYLQTSTKTADPQSEYLCCGPKAAMRAVVGESVVKCLSTMSAEERKEKVMVIDSDLGGSTNFNKIQKAYPEIYVQSGVMERGNFSAAAGFGMEEGKQGVFSTFAAFLEMCLSEITMARLNNSNVFSHFSHSGSDDMADNTCHFGLNNLMADNGLEDGYDTKLYFPADPLQAAALVDVVFFQPGLRFVFTTRSKTPKLLKPDGTEHYGEGYTFVPGKDEVLREGSAGYVLCFGDAVYRCMDAVEKLRAEGIDVGLVNKPSLNVVDEDCIKTVGSAPFLLIVEPLSKKTGLGSKYGTYLLERGLAPKFATIGNQSVSCSVDVTTSMSMSMSMCVYTLASSVVTCQLSAKGSGVAVHAFCRGAPGGLRRALGARLPPGLRLTVGAGQGQEHDRVKLLPMNSSRIVIKLAVSLAPPLYSYKVTLCSLVGVARTTSSSEPCKRPPMLSKANNCQTSHSLCHFALLLCTPCEIESVRTHNSYPRKRHTIQGQVTDTTKGRR
jgi:transketolase